MSDAKKLTRGVLDARLSQIETGARITLSQIATLRKELGVPAKPAPLKDGEKPARSEGARALRGDMPPRNKNGGGTGGAPPEPDGEPREMVTGGGEAWPLKIEGKWYVKLPDGRKGAEGAPVIVTPRRDSRGKPYQAWLEDFFDHNEWGDEIWTVRRKGER